MDFCGPQPFLFSCTFISVSYTHLGVCENTDQMEYHYGSGDIDRTEVVVSLETGRYENWEAWEEKAIKKNKAGISLVQNQDWWKKYFHKSFIIIDEKLSLIHIFPVRKIRNHEKNDPETASACTSSGYF